MDKNILLDQRTISFTSIKYEIVCSDLLDFSTFEWDCQPSKQLRYSQDTAVISVKSPGTKKSDGAWKLQIYNLPTAKKQTHSLTTSQLLDFQTVNRLNTTGLRSWVQLEEKSAFCPHQRSLSCRHLTVGVMDFWVLLYDLCKQSHNMWICLNCVQTRNRSWRTRTHWYCNSGHRILIDMHETPPVCSQFALGPRVSNLLMYTCSLLWDPLACFIALKPQRCCKMKVKFAHFFSETISALRRTFVHTRLSLPPKGAEVWQSLWIKDLGCWRRQLESKTPPVSDPRSFRTAGKHRCSGDLGESYLPQQDPRDKFRFSTSETTNLSLESLKRSSHICEESTFTAKWTSLVAQRERWPAHIPYQAWLDHNQEGEHRQTFNESKWHQITDDNNSFEDDTHLFMAANTCVYPGSPSHMQTGGSPNLSAPELIQSWTTCRTSGMSRFVATLNINEIHP